MHLCRSWIALGVLAVAAGSIAVRAAVVYKWTDADGVVHLSDQPVPGAEKIVTESGSSRRSAPPASSYAASATEPKPAASAPLASQCAIVSPVKDQTITGNQPVPVHLTLQPELKSTQSIAWTLNGSALPEPPDATQFTLEDLPRGSYTLGATVTDQSSGETKSAESVTFYVVQPSLFSPQHKKVP